MVTVLITLFQLGMFAACWHMLGASRENYRSARCFHQEAERVYQRTTRILQDAELDRRRAYRR